MYENVPRECPYCHGELDLDLDLDFKSGEVISNIVCNNSNCDEWLIIKEYCRQAVEE